MSDLRHLAIDEPAGKVDCSVCGTGITAPPSFGGIPRSTLLASFVVQHSTHTKTGRPSGLTTGGNVTRQARALFGGDS